MSVYLKPFRRSSFLECVLQPKIAKSIKTPYFWSLGSFKVIDADTTEKLVIVLVAIGSMPMPICNRFHERLVNNGKITTLRKYRSLMPSCAGFLEPRKSILEPSKSTFNDKNLICSFSMSVSIDFGAIRSWKLCRSTKSPPKSIKTPILAFKVIQGHWIWRQLKASVRLPISD